MTKLLIIAGTRPEVIKLAPVFKELQRRPRLNPILCTTGQHREMLDQMMDFFALTADMDLDLMRPGQTPTEVASRAIHKVGELVAALAPEWVIVQGDTTTAMASSVAAFYGRAKIAHVEAGLRTKDPYRPFPEEMNRRLISRAASLHFTPTAVAADALRAENIDNDAIHTVGNTVIDALFQTRDRVTSGEIQLPPVWRAGADRAKTILVTSHRRENFDSGIQEICAALNEFTRQRPDWTIVFPVHPNPAIHDPVRKILADSASIYLTEPQGYGDFVALMTAAAFIVTDSGGVQEEGSALGKPIIVLRSETERPEAVMNGNAVLVGSDKSRILNEMLLLANNEHERRQRARPCLAYGDGLASKRIADVLENAKWQ